ncbi:flagellar brake protein [Candidatus Formimonas warabiya]|uniref:Flagellar brake protein n=1 Tax=Formimonas warabiya TaxID=1761012 RepID=A0A3G1KT70_FORW1|nr:flagellar brake protein [Candidatus Formimonas warabiya]ATW25649.1 hypothetical protein DCMF_13540 [Candidatus Formimonas warabiya]
MQLNECLGVKQKIEIKKNGDREFYVSAVQQLNNNSLYIDVPLLARRPLVLAPGTLVNVRFASGEGQFEFDAQVVGSHPGTIPFYEISLPKDIRVGQRRSLFRLGIILDAECWEEMPSPSPTSKEKTLPKKVKAKTVNISGSGVKISSFEPLKNGQQLTLLIKFEGAEPQKFLTKVMWTNREQRYDDTYIYYSGLKFVNISRKAQDNLISYLFKIQARRRLIEKAGE